MRAQVSLFDLKKRCCAEIWKWVFEKWDFGIVALCFKISMETRQPKKNYVREKIADSDQQV